MKLIVCSLDDTEYPDFVYEVPFQFAPALLILRQVHHSNVKHKNEANLAYMQDLSGYP